MPCDKMMQGAVIKVYIVGRQPIYNKQQVLHTVVDCLWRQGYAATPISELVERTGLKAPSLYALFGSKKGMMLASLEAYASDALQELDSLLNEHQAGIEQIQALLHHMLEASLHDAAGKGCFLVNSALECHGENPEFAPCINSTMQALRQRMQKALEQAPDRSPDLSPAEGALFLQAQIWALKLLARMGPSREQGEVIIKQALRVLFSPQACAAREQNKDE